MIKTVERPREGCSFHGALRAVLGIDGAVSIVHSNAGCAAQDFIASGLGLRGGEFAVPSTNVIEKQVIFGGGSRLREQIKNTIKVVDGRLYVVLNGCESAMVGDDISGMTKEAAEQGEPVVCCGVAGFHGGARVGGARLIRDAIEGAASLRNFRGHEDGPRTVNVFGVLPGTDIFWRGDILELRRILSGLGFGVNAFFGPAGGALELASAPDAVCSLIFSKWGRLAAEFVSERWGVPTIEFPSLPVGAEGVRGMANVIYEKLGAGDGERASAEKFLADEERTYSYYARVASGYFGEVAGTAAALVGDESAVLRIGGFLRDSLGAVIELAVITDSSVGDTINFSEAEIAETVRRSSDSGEIRELIASSGAEIILGSSLEAGPAQSLGVPLLEISYPYGRPLALNKTYSGVSGAIELTGDYISKIVEAQRLRAVSAAGELRTRG
jgi:nitrogenase molybdenum-iron protein beta chain